MNRRTLLAASGLFATSFAGCLRRIQIQYGGDPPVEKLDADSALDIGYWNHPPAISDTATATTLVQFGHGDNSHWVILAADSSSVVETTISVRREDGKPFYQETVSLSTEQYAGYQFRRPGDYILKLSSALQSGSVNIPSDSIDCNRSYQRLILSGEGIDESSMSSDVGCQFY